MTETKNQKVLTGNILSFDFGERRVGVAIGNNITNNIHPLETIEASKKIDRYNWVGFHVSSNDSILLYLSIFFDASIVSSG
jgi:hypothetical protein